MPSLAEASLTDAERRLLERFVALLEEELGDSLRAVWLYGSRARGEGSGPDSDIDLLVITERAREGDSDRVQELLHWAAGNDDDGSQWLVMAHIGDLRWLAGRRAIDAFYIQEVDRDKIVLAGDRLDEVGREPEGGTGAGVGVIAGDGSDQTGAELAVSRRSAEYMDIAQRHLRLARLGRDHGLSTGVVSLAYKAMLNAARAALSEEDRFSRTHRGTWHLFRKTFVVSGRFDPSLHSKAQEAQKLREYDDYGRRLIRRDEAVAAVGLAERFVRAVEEMLGVR